MRARALGGPAGLAIAFAASGALSSRACAGSDDVIRSPVCPSPRCPALGDPNAPRKGTLRFRADEEPTTLNPFIGESNAARSIRGYGVESLLQRNGDTAEWEPQLAASWTIDPRAKTFDFDVRPNARWNDGSPVTADDVVFSFESIFDPRFRRASMRPWFEPFRSVRALGPCKVRFEAKERRFTDFIAAATLPILSRKAYGRPEAALASHDAFVGSGPYQIESWAKGRMITMKRNPFWWGWKDALVRGRHPPERLSFRFASDRRLALELLKKGQIDVVELSPEEYLRALGERNRAYGLQVVRNRAPQYMNALAFNLRSPLFSDVRVRRALAMAIDRDLVINKFYRGLQRKASGPWYAQSPFADPDVPPVPYDPKGALALLKSAGWQTGAADGLLRKEIAGRQTPFRFELATSSADSLRHLTFIKEEFADVGVDMSIRRVGSGALSALVNGGQFDAADFGWSGSPEFDPGAGWESEAATGGAKGLNLVGFANPEVDRLAREIRGLYAFQDRLKPTRRMFRLVAEDVGFVFLFNEEAQFYAFSARVGRERPFHRYDSGSSYWWVKEKAP